MTLAQYDAIVTAGSMQGTSPLHGQANSDALLSTCQRFDIDPRVLLAGLLFEDHFGTDPNGGAAASVLNFSGIKWAGQANGYDSGLPADTGGTYAGFRDIGAYADEFCRTLTNQYIGPYFNAGDLANAWSVYITGQPNSGHGQERVDQFAYYTAHFPPQGGNVVDTGVYGEDLIAYARTLIGQANSTMETDPINGVHPWAYWCESLAERVPGHLGMTQVARGSAELKRQALAAQGLLQQGTPEHGAWVLFDTRFYAPDGHICFWDADKGQVLGTLTDGTGIGYRSWGPSTYGYGGWARVPGVVGDRRSAAPPAPIPDPPHPPMQANWVPTPNPYDPHPGVRGVEIGLGGGFLTKYRAIPDAMTVLGWPLANEQPALVDGRRMTIQRFERGTLLYAPLDPPPWDVVVALRTQVIQPL